MLPDDGTDAGPTANGSTVIAELAGGMTACCVGLHPIRIALSPTAVTTDPFTP